MTTMRLYLSDLHSASIDRLQEELAAGGIESTSDDRPYLIEAVVRLLCETWGPFDLHDSNNDVVRDATTEETVESVLAGPEGWIEVDGQRVYVAE